MQADEIQAKLLQLLTRIAPDVDPQSVVADQDFRDQFDFDSMDALHFAVAVSEAYGIPIAEADTGRLANLKSAADFVRGRLAPPS
ncbi:MAG: acyl carrier protein [Gammaproteobacteria bacterium]|nr:acyl carrier protein [Gammaproteobacteria bacterium]